MGRCRGSASRGRGGVTWGTRTRRLNLSRGGLRGASSGFIFPDDLGLGGSVVRLLDLDGDLGRVLELDGPLVHHHPPLNRRTGSCGPGRRDRLGKRAGGKHEDPLAAGRTAKCLVSLGSLTPDPVSERADDAVVLHLDDTRSPQPLEQVTRSAKQIQSAPLPAQPLGSRPVRRSSRGMAVVITRLDEMTIVQIIRKDVSLVNRSEGGHGLHLMPAWSWALESSPRDGVERDSPCHGRRGIRKQNRVPFAWVDSKSIVPP